MLLGEHNTKRLNNENDAAEQLEAYAKERGMTVVSCDDPAWDKALLDWMINPLANAKEKKPEESEEGFALEGSISVKCKRPNHASASKDSESVPPVFDLHPGERITHIAIMRPNENKTSYRWRGL